MPRPEWYFFFLFELLRVIKPPALVSARDDRRADDLHDPAVPAAVLRPQPGAAPERRPIATTAGIFTIAAMAYLTYLGAHAGSPTDDRSIPARSAGPQLTSRAGKQVAAQSGCLGLPQDRRERQRRPGPEPDPDRRAPADAGDRAHARQPDGADAVLHGPAQENPQKFNALVEFLAQLK